MKLRLFHLRLWLFRSHTLCVRIVVLDESKRVLLVKHSYEDAWHLPGGGIETGDTAYQTIERELLEETGLVAVSAPKLLGIFLNKKHSRRDHILLFHIEAWEKKCDFLANEEIAEIGFFSFGNFPPGATESTIKRMDEFLNNAKSDEIW